MQTLTIKKCGKKSWDSEVQWNSECVPGSGGRMTFGHKKIDEAVKYCLKIALDTKEKKIYLRTKLQ
jgi:hypothetical protein